LQEAIGRPKHTRSCKGQNEPAATIFQCITDQHRGHGEEAQERKRVQNHSSIRRSIHQFLKRPEPIRNTGRVTALLRALSVNHTVVLIEHDMDAIFAAADTLTVLVEGKLLAHGKPEDIRRDRAVREAYLGRWGQEIVR
jgi:branched-chain amino acid transport system permease protein